jgi:hypothetical protein
VVDRSDLYVVLQVDPGAETDVIKAAYRTLAAKRPSGRRRIGRSDGRAEQRLVGALGPRRPTGVTSSSGASG